MALREQFGTKWTRTSSRTLTDSFWSVALSLSLSLFLSLSLSISLIYISICHVHTLNPSPSHRFTLRPHTPSDALRIAPARARGGGQGWLTRIRLADSDKVG